MSFLHAPREFLRDFARVCEEVNCGDELNDMHAHALTLAVHAADIGSSQFDDARVEFRKVITRVFVKTSSLDYVAKSQLHARAIAEFHTCVSQERWQWRGYF